MIRFIQRYEKYFYIVITTVIVVSFSFFGTWNAINSPTGHEQVAFKALDGQSISRGELEELVSFIQTDSLDKKMWGPVWGPNFLNDGVIRKDFLENGMGQVLAESYPEYIRDDLEYKRLKEKTYRSYAHPGASFLSAEGAWSYFAPNINQNLKLIQLAQDPLDPGSFKARIDLYLAEKEFPAPALAQVLRFQESRYTWLNPDSALTQQDLSLFGYHSVDDWFGPKFSRLIAEFILNSAILAEDKGYRVSKEEAWADLVKNASVSFKEVSKTGELHANNESAYLKEQLRIMGMDSNRATKIWQKVMLFRRLFHDVANTNAIEPKTLQLPNSWTSEYALGELYRLPRALRFSDMMDLAEFEVYVNRAAGMKEGTLQPPSNALTIEDISKKSPELVGKRYLVVVTGADLKALESRVSLKDTLQWESQEENFKLLKKEFSDLGIKDGATLDARVAALDSLPDVMRAKVDAFARAKVANSRPEWISQTLVTAPPETKTLTLYLKNQGEPLPGIKDKEAFRKTLDQAALGDELTFNAPNFVYKIKLIDRSPNYEIATFEEAKNNGTLTALLNAELESYYTKIKTENDDKFKKENGSYKSFDEARRQVAEQWLQKSLANIQMAATENLKDKAPKSLIPDLAASLRFTSWATIAQNNNKAILEEIALEPESDKLSSKAPFEDQFKWIKIEKKISRGTKDDLIDKDKLFAQKPGEWSNLSTPSNGDLSFFRLQSRKAEINQELLNEQTLALRQVIGSEAERSYMQDVIALLKEKKAISFDYLAQPTEEFEPIQDNT